MTLAAIFGCSGPQLLPEERRFFSEVQPFGFILFKRNAEHPAQLRELCANLREAVGNPGAPILIDQEGGRVARLRPPHWRIRPAAALFGAIAEKNFEIAEHAVRLNAFLLGCELAECGIDVDCAPVLDLRVEGAHDIIGDRAFGADPALVSRLGLAMAEGLAEAGIMPIQKHIPGHGRAKTDSHLTLPVVDAKPEELAGTDFAAFALAKDIPWAMTAHILFSAIDSEQPVTLSPRLIQNVIRREIGFDGLLLTDDLSMQALGGSFAERSREALAAGCDILLHCNGNMEEMREIATAGRPLMADAKRRANAAEAWRSVRRGRLQYDRNESTRQLHAIMQLHGGSEAIMALGSGF